MLQVVQRADLARGVSLQGQGQLGHGDAAAIVFDQDLAHAAAHQLDGDLGGARVQRVVDQLAHHGGRALDHLAGRDLADQFIGQGLDGAPGRGSPRNGRVGGLGREPAGAEGVSCHAIIVKATLASVGAQASMPSGECLAPLFAPPLSAFMTPTGAPAMEIVTFLIDFILHIDKHLKEFVDAYGTLVYALLFLIVFVETGLVVMPFLPGDSLLFMVGTLAAADAMSLPLAIAILLVAAITGDQLNYSIGRYFGPKVFQWEDSRFFNRKAFDAAHAFYEKHGGVTIILARFMPFIRTFAPFVAGVAEMDRAKFTAYNVVGAVIWVVGLCVAGYLFGNIPFVQQHLSKIILAMIIVPGLIALYGGWRAARADKQAASAA